MQQNSEPKKDDVSLPVDLIRTVAIILVIFVHAAQEPDTSLALMSPQGVQLWWASNVFSSLALTAVPLFVILTGALLLQPSKTNEPVGVFLKKRASRIALPLVFWGIVYFAWRAFVQGEVLTSTSVLRGVLAGPYVQFWYVYVLLGLYLLTPAVRIVVAHADWRLIRYLLVVWFVGTAIIPLLGLYTSLSDQATWFKQSIFIASGLVGYFLLGAYITKIKVRTSVLVAAFLGGFAWTAVGTYLVVGNLGGSFTGFFYDASSFSMIITSISLFMLLALFPYRAVENRYPWFSRVLKIISVNTLAIWLFHMIVLESLQQGYLLGFTLSLTKLNPIVEIPLVTALTLLICLAVIVPLKKVPYLRELIG
jgi:surface polysaccharide O-acyltransferase-like enzyme